MASDYLMMLRTALQIQGAMAASYADIASRSGRFLQQSAATLATAVAGPLRSGPLNRQNALEEAVWTGFVCHDRLLRGINGLSRMAMLSMLNQLDLQRGAIASPQRHRDDKPPTFV